MVKIEYTTKCMGCGATIPDDAVKAIKAVGVAEHLIGTDLLIVQVESNRLRADNVGEIAITDASDDAEVLHHVLTYTDKRWVDIHDEVLGVLGEDRRWAAWDPLFVERTIGIASRTIGRESPLPEESAEAGLRTLTSDALGKEVGTIHEALQELLGVEERPDLRSSLDEARAVGKILRVLAIPEVEL